MAQPFQLPYSFPYVGICPVFMLAKIRKALQTSVPKRLPCM